MSSKELTQSGIIRALAAIDILCLKIRFCVFLVFGLTSDSFQFYDFQLSHNSTFDIVYYFSSLVPRKLAAAKAALYGIET